MRRVFRIGEKIWDDHDKRWGVVLLVCGQDRDDVVYSDNIITYKPDDSDGEAEVEASRCYQLAEGKTFSGFPVCWEHSDEICTDYSFFCPDLEENCFYFELD